MTCKLPEGYEAPEGDEFDAVVTFKKNQDGSVTLTEIEGMAMGSPEGPELEVEISTEPSTVYDRARAAGVPMKV